MNNRLGTVSRLATPVKAWVQRFAVFLLVTAALALTLLGKTDSTIVHKTRVAVTDAVAPILDFASRPIGSAVDAIETTSSFTPRTPRTGSSMTVRR